MRWTDVLWAPLACAIVLAGCGGEGAFNDGAGGVAGTVRDIDNNPVRDATVSVGSAETRTSPTGAYLLEDVPEGEVLVRASIVRNGVTFRGQTMARATASDTVQSVNIVVSRTSTQARVRGTVRLPNGDLLSGASVFAHAGVGSSQRTFTNSRGEYELRELAPDITYELSAGGRTLESDQRQVVLDPGEVRTVNFVVDDAGFPALTPPQGLDAVSWVSPRDATRSASSDPYEWIKTLFDPKRAGRNAPTQTRQFFGDHLVEVEIDWTPDTFPELLGYGIYRGQGAANPSSYDFYPEPLAAYYVDAGAATFTSYSYRLTTLSANYPDFAGTESALSSTVSVDTLGPLDLSNVTLSPLTFNWFLGSGAEEYVVFLFDRFPGVGVTSIWSNDTFVSDTDVVYDGPPLDPDQTYYYVVLGLSDGIRNRTISKIGSFQP